MRILTSAFVKLVQFTKHSTKLVVGISVATVVAGGSTAVVLASIPDASGVIHACYQNGMFRVIDSPSASCNSSETALNFNQTGPAGATGATGATGPAGPGLSGGVLVVNWGDIEANGTPQTVFSLPGFGDLLALKCDSEGNMDFGFKNTSGGNLHLGAEADPMVLANNAVISSSNEDFFGPVIVLATTSGSVVALPQVISAASTTSETCRFFGFML
jgi:hypothetical protein